MSEGIVIAGYYKGQHFNIVAVDRFKPCLPGWVWVKLSDQSGHVYREIRKAFLPE